MDENCTILVTGATGNCGGACARFLLANSQPAHVQIRCMVRDVASVGALALQTLGAELVRGDFGDAASLAAACRGVSAAFLGCSNQREQVAFETAFITAAAESPTLRYLVKLSTCGNVISPDSPVEYGRIHAATEAALEAAFEKRSWTILRPNYFYQNHAGDIFGTLPKKLLAYPRSEAQLESGKCRAVDTRDVGEVAAKLLLIHASRRPAAAAHHGQRYDVSGPEGWSVRGLAALYEGALELPSGSIACLTLSEDEAAAGLEQAGFPDWLARAVAVGQARYGAAGMNDYPSSEAVLALHPTFRTFQAWVDEHKALVKLESA